jgi:hypothetical protein
MRFQLAPIMVKQSPVNIALAKFSDESHAEELRVTQIAEARSSRMNIRDGRAMTKRNSWPQSFGMKEENESGNGAMLSLPFFGDIKVTGAQAKSSSGETVPSVSLVTPLSQKETSEVRTTSAQEGRNMTSAAPNN